MGQVEWSIWRVTDERGRRRVTDWLMSEYEVHRQFPNGAPERLSFTSVWIDLEPAPVVTKDGSGNQFVMQGAAIKTRAVRGRTEPMRLLVCGGRDYSRRDRVFAALDKVLALRPIEVVIHGGARGADALADEWAEARGIARRAFPVSRQEWRELGRVAGPLRNSRMLREALPDGVVAFPGGPGTADMVKRADAQGLKVWRPFG